MLHGHLDPLVIPKDVLNLLFAYHEQALYLKDEEQTEAFVATASVIKGKDGKVFTSSVWTQGIEILLPKTDLVTFIVNEEEVAAIATWEKVSEAFKDFIEETEMKPPRYLVRKFPPIEAVRGLGNVLAPPGIRVTWSNN